MGAELVVFWCETCKKRVCEALPKAMVWCACGRRAKPVEGAQPVEGGRKRRRGKVEKVKSEATRVQVGLPL